jgi:DeoR/GlpR family transcriptional regulator of sugar metabolism
LISLIKPPTLPGMRVPIHVVEARREKLAALIERHRYLPIGELCRQLGVSEATARRDLAVLAGRSKVKRTHGGALAEFNERFPSFHERQAGAARSKARVAGKALGFFKPGGTYFLDSGTTIFALAEAFRDAPVTPMTIVTSNIPVGELLSSIPDLNVFLTGGQILGRQSVLLGETARRSLEFWSFDMAMLSAEAANREGIWNSQDSIVQQQTIAIRRSTHAVYCLDASKIGSQASFLLRRWPEVDFLLTDAPTEKLVRAGIPEKVVVSCHPSAPFPDTSPIVKPSFPIHFL